MTLSRDCPPIPLLAARFKELLVLRLQDLVEHANLYPRYCLHSANYTRAIYRCGLQMRLIVKKRKLKWGSQKLRRPAQRGRMLVCFFDTGRNCGIGGD